MKAKSLILIMAVLVLSTASFAAWGFKSLLFEDFEEVSPPGLPPGWIALNANGDTAEWETRSYGGVTWGRDCIRYNNDPINQSDDWFFTSGIDLEAHDYDLYFMYRCSSAGHPESLSVWIGTAQDPDSMTMPAWSNPAITNTDYEKAQGWFLVSTPGTYYLGFHVVPIVSVVSIALLKYGRLGRPGQGRQRRRFGHPFHAFKKRRIRP